MMSLSDGSIGDYIIAKHSRDRRKNRVERAAQYTCALLGASDKNALQFSLNV